MNGQTKSTDAPIFVVGTPRSGTTLTSRILNNHSRIFVPAETHFFNDIYARRRRLGDPRNPAVADRIRQRFLTLYKRQHEGGYQKRIQHLLADAETLARRMGPFDNYREALSAFMEMQMTDAGKMRWGNQVPRDLFNLPEILSLYPDAKIVICIRDVRDFIVSYNQMKDVLQPHHVRRHRSLYHPIVTSLLWRASMLRIEPARRLVPEGNLMILRYEDLVSRPEATVENLCAFVGEPFEPNLLNVRANNSSDVTSRDHGSGIFDSSVGRWRQTATPEHCYIAQKIAGTLLADLGYRAERIDGSRVRLAWLILSFPFALVRGLYTNRRKQGAFAPYVARRAMALLRSGSG